jgi:DinB superfamily
MNEQQKDQTLREHLLSLLTGGQAYAKFDDIVADFPPDLRGKKLKGMPNTAWMLLEHMRIAQWDILDFSINPKYKAMKFPDDYWPKKEAPPTAAAWNNGIKEFKKDLKAMQDLIADPKTDLYQKIPWGDGQTILREALLIADHNAYHLGQLVTLRRLLGAWKEQG